MAKSRFSKMKISGFSVVVPDNPRHIDEDLALFDNDQSKLERAKRVIGFGTRYMGEEGCTGSDYCIAAARRLIDALKVDINEIDILICAIQKGDYIQPGPSSIIHQALNLPKSCAVFDINHGCTGFIYGLWMAGGLLEGGTCKKILLLAGEHYSYAPDQRDSMLFCDAGSATLLEYDPQAKPSYFNIQADGSGLDSLVIPAGGARLPIDHEILDLTVTNKIGETLNLLEAYMDGLEVFKFTIREVPPNVKELLEFAGMTLEEIDFMASHQANKQIVDQVSVRIGLKPEQYSTETFSTYGNQGPASIPGVMSHLLRDKIKNGRQRIIMSGFGIGTAWGSAVFDLENVYCEEIAREKIKPRRSREEEIAHWLEKLKK